MVLKPNMIVPGAECVTQAPDQEIAEKTIRVLKNCVPSAVPGIAFLSGGQSDVEATARPDAVNRVGGFPWHLTFSYGRALQHAPQMAWAGKTDNVSAAQAAFSHRAEMNGLATLGKWTSEIEKKAA
jgi:fructose-bisphosphate aldolase class I